MAQPIINTENIKNGAIVINGVMVCEFAHIDIEEELNLKTYTVEYRYYGCTNFFKKEIPAESLAEALYDAREWIEAQNATIGNRSKVGNYIDIAFVREWSGKEQAALEF